MKRVLIFSLNYYPRFIGGAEVAIKEITERIPRDDVEFHMVTLRHDATLAKEEQVGNILVHRIGLVRVAPDISDLKRFPLILNRYLYQLYAVIKALHLYHQYHYDGVWAVMAHSAGIPAGMFKRLVPKVRYLLTLQEGDPLLQIERTMLLVWPLFANAFSAADHTQAISTFLASWAKRIGYKGDVSVVPNGVDYTLFSKPISREVRIQQRRMLGITEGDTVLVTSSRLVHKNGIDTVIAALPLLPTHVHFVIYGIGPLEKRLKKFAYTKNVASRVHFVGKVAHADLPTRLSVGDIFIRPSRSEGMGNSFIEAYAAGLPVIATQVGGITDFLFDAECNKNKPTTGWAVEVDSPESITRAVENIRAHPERVRQVTETARQLAKTGYDWNTIAKKFNLAIFPKLFL